MLCHKGGLNAMGVGFEFSVSKGRMALFICSWMELFFYFSTGEQLTYTVGFGAGHFVTISERNDGVLIR